MGSIIATVTHLQQELRQAKDVQQEAKDREIDAKVYLRKSENEVAQLGRDLFGSWEEMREAQENVRNHETLVLLKRARAENPVAVSQVDRALIQSIEEQLNDPH